MSANSAIFNPTETTSAATGDGFSVPRLTTTGRLAITFGTGDKGMMVYDTTLNNLFIWNGAAWESVPASGDSTNTQVIFNDNGILAGNAGLLFDKTLQRLIVAGNLRISRGLLNQGTSTAVGDDTLDVTVVGANANTAVGYRAASQLTSGSLNTAVGYLALKGAVGAFTGSGNVGVGANAGSSLTSGSNNVAVGTNALLSTGLITGSDNIGIGQSTFSSLSSGSDNVAIGRLTNGILTTGNENISIGVGSGYSFTTGNGNVAIGRAAFGNNAQPSSGFYNIALGWLSMYSANSIAGADNVGIGRDTFRSLSSGADNVGIGRTALNQVSTGSTNVAIGFQSLAVISTGSNSVAIGNSALINSNANDNVAIGAAALAGNTTGIQSTAVGRSALLLTTGSNNTAFGSSAGSNITTGTNNICIGVSANASAASNSNELVIGSSTSFVATAGGATTYYTTASALSTGSLPPNCGFIRVYLNGSFVKIPVYGN